MPRPTHRVAVRHPQTGGYIALDMEVDYDPADPLVEAYAWAFAPIEDGHKIIESVDVPVVEQASARPGEKRRIRKPKNA